jgi:hypothetical protein
MRTPPILALAKTFGAHVANTIRLFFSGSSQPEDEAYLSPLNFPPLPTIDLGLQYERYSEAVRQLCPSFPLTCTFLEPDEVKVVGDTPVGAGGFADIWKGTLDGRTVLQKSYRRYKYCDIESIFQARNGSSARTATAHIPFQRYLGEVWACAHLSHPNIVQFVGINPTPNHPFSLVINNADHLGLKEYLQKNPTANRLKLVRYLAPDRGLPDSYSRC